MSRTVVSLRLSAPELQFIDQFAAEKGLNRSAALHQIFLQQVALQEIEKSVSRVIDSRLSELHAAIAGVRLAAEQNITRDDLAKATNYITDRIKKS